MSDFIVMSTELLDKH